MLRLIALALLANAVVAGNAYSCTYAYDAQGRHAVASISGTVNTSFTYEIRVRHDFMLHKGWALGDDRFRAQIEVLGKRRAAPLPKGRPRSEEGE